MENQSPSTNASTWLSRKPAALDERDTELSKLKERLGFYESFDQIIQDNVARAGELLRHAAAMRENAEESLSMAKQEIEQSRVTERQDFRALLSGLLDDVTTMQVQVERLARKVADALDDIESTLPAGLDMDRLPSDLPQPVHALTADASSEPWSSLTLDPTPDEIGPAETQDTEAAAMGAAPNAAADEPFEIEADIAAAEATELNDTANYLAAESMSFGDESSEVDTLVVGAPRASSSDEPTAASDAETANPAAHDDGFPVGPNSTPVEPATSDGTTGAESFESNAIAAEAADAAAPAPVEEAIVAEPEVMNDHEAEAAAASEPGETESANEVRDPLAANVASAPEPEVDPAALTTPMTRSDVRPFPSGGLGSTPRTGTGELRAQELARYPPPTMVALGARGVGTVVLVHGVPRATTALSLKRFLESLPHVAAVEPREYAEGVLRLHVTAQRAVQVDDLRGWSDGTGFEPVHIREDLVEVRLPH